MWAELVPMHRRRNPATAAAAATIAAALIALGLPPSARAQSSPPPAPAAERTEQVIVPEVERRDVRLPRIPDNDFTAGVFVGTYSTQNFGASVVYGLKLGYHITEDVFVEAAYGQTRVSDEDFRQILPGGIFGAPEERLRYLNLSAGYNVLPGEVFFGRRHARPSALYLIAGVGSTSFVDQRKQTFNVGLGLRVFVADWGALQVDLRDHVFPLDLLGRNRTTQNLELTAGFTAFF